MKLGAFSLLLLQFFLFMYHISVDVESSDLTK